MAQPRQNFNYDYHYYNDQYHPDLNLLVSYNTNHQLSDNYHPPISDTLTSHLTDNNSSSHHAGHLTTQAPTNLATIWPLAPPRYTRAQSVAPTSKYYSSTIHAASLS